MTRFFVSLAILVDALKMFDNFTSYYTIGYIEGDFTIQVDVAHDR